MIIFLGLLSPIDSSGLPTGRCEQHLLFLSWPCTRWGLHSHIVTYMLVSSYLAFPPLPLLAVYLCCTILKIALTRRYLAPCSTVLRLSSRISTCDHLLYLTSTYFITDIKKNKVFISFF